jgi:electron transport complex protein RnfG
MLKLFLTVTIFSAVSGGLLSLVRSSTQARIEYQQLKFVKGPTLREIMKGCENDPIVDRFKMKYGKTQRTIFIGIFDGRPKAIALEGFGKGFGGEIGVIVGIDVMTDKIIGIGITTHHETPGVGSRAKTDPSFRGQFKGRSITEAFKVKSDGGQIDAVTGATISSRGVCQAVNNAISVYKRLKPEILKRLKRVKS